MLIYEREKFLRGLLDDIAGPIARELFEEIDRLRVDREVNERKWLNIAGTLTKERDQFLEQIMSATAMAQYAIRLLEDSCESISDKNIRAKVRHFIDKLANESTDPTLLLHDNEW